MPYYVARGPMPHKRHTQFRKADGSLYHEELLGSEGFAGASTLVYRLHPPTAVQAMQAQPPMPREVWDDDLHRHHLFRTLLAEPEGDAISGRKTLFFNQDVAFSILRPAGPMAYFFRNAYANELYFVHEGSGTLATAFGRIDYRPGDYLVVPHNTTYQLQPRPGTEYDQRLVLIEAAGYIEPPKRYLNEYGQFLEWAPYCERDLRPPAEIETYDERGEYEVRVKTGTKVTSYVYAEHPFDVVGWDGCLYPYALNIADFEPITGRIHQPPPVHQVFQIPGAVVCNFLPRKIDYHPQSIPSPYNHSNIDSDEVLYFVNGQMLGRKAVEVASISLHPSGIPHGPKPGGLEASIGHTETDEIAVMLDTFRPLTLTQAARTFDDPAYPMAWLPREQGVGPRG